MSDSSEIILRSRVQLRPEAQEKLDLAQYFIRSYSASRQGLTRLGILRSERSLQGDYAEWLVSELLGLRLATSGVQKDYDATDSLGARYQIKSRLCHPVRGSTSFDFKRHGHYFDYLMCVFFSPELDIHAILRVPYEVVLDHMRDKDKEEKDMKPRFAWDKRARQDTRIDRLIWPEE